MFCMRKCSWCGRSDDGREKGGGVNIYVCTPSYVLYMKRGEKTHFAGRETFGMDMVSTGWRQVVHRPYYKKKAAWKGEIEASMSLSCLFLYFFKNVFVCYKPVFSYYSQLVLLSVSALDIECYPERRKT